MAIRILLLLAFVGAIPVLAQPETGAVRVFVTDEAKAVIPSARILLDGPLQRESVTDREGVTIIHNLPAGTYQLRALLPGWDEVRLSLDVQADSTTEQRLVLRVGTMMEPGYAKPVRQTINTACRGGNPPVSIPEFVKQADAVAHVRVRERRGQRRVPRDEQSGLITRNIVDVLAVFKSHPLWPTVGYRAEIRQVGGDLGRGDYIEVMRNICLDPLIVGREYVVALERSDWLGGWGVFFGGEGALLIDAARLDPLGGGELAESWRSRPVADLFAALAKLRR